MAARYGLLLLAGDFTQEIAMLFGRLDVVDYQPAGPTDNVPPLMTKAEDGLVAVGCCNGWTILCGQYDFNSLPDCSAARFASGEPVMPHIVYFATEGTSGGLVFEEYRDGELTRSYCQCEGVVEQARCINMPVLTSLRGQVDEWILLEEVLPKDLTANAIVGASVTHFRINLRPRKSRKSADAANGRQKWWKLWMAL